MINILRAWAGGAFISLGYAIVPDYYFQNMMDSTHEHD